MRERKPMTKENALAGQRGMFFVMLVMIVMIWGMVFYFRSPLILLDGADMVVETAVSSDAYLNQVLAVCSLLICVPFALKWMTLGFVRKNIVSEPQGIYVGYFIQYAYRMLLLILPFIFNSVSYIDNPRPTPIFCAAIAFIGMAFCYPSRERMNYELNFIEGEVDEDGKIKGK